jgi:hypothetical protein
MRTTTTLAAGVLLALAGCGGGDDKSSSDQVQDVATKYTRASERGDAAAACALVSKDRLAEYGGQAACEAKEKHDPVPEEAELTYRDVTVDGSSARLVQINAGDSARSFELVQEDGDWKVRRVGTYRALPQQ